MTLAAAKATLGFYKNNDVIDRLWRNGKILFDSIQRLIIDKKMQDYVFIIGLPVRFQVIFKDANGETNYFLNALFQQEMTKKGIICFSNPGVSYSHTDTDQLYTAWCFGEMLNIMKIAIQHGDIEKYIEGYPSQPVFKALRDQKQTAN